MACELQVGPTTDGTVVSLVGRGTMCESPAFRDTVEHLLEQGDVVVDASQCDYLDSTFLGCLIGLKKSCEDGKHHKFVIAASLSMRIKLFCTSSLDKYFEFVEQAPRVSGPRDTISIGSPRREDLGHHIMKCHERLAELGGREAPAFRAIADRLAKDLSERVSIE